MSVSQDEQRRALHDAHADRGHGVPDRACREPALRDQPGHGVGRGHVGAGDRRGAGATIGLQHVAVDQDAALAQGGQVEHAAQAAADQALDLLRAPALLATGGLAVAPGVGGARQHAVLGRHPALAAATLVRRHLLFHRGRAQHLGVAEAHQHRALGMAGEATLERDRAQGIVCAAIAAQVVRHQEPQGFL
jgi:hypothetical protein